MNIVHVISKRTDRRDQACEWVAKLDRGLNAREKQDLQDWYERHPGNAEALLEVAFTWDRMDSLSRLSDLFPIDQSRSKSWARPTLALTASLMLTVMAWFWLDFQSGAQDFGANSVDSIAKAYETAVGVQSRINLQDDSELILNTDSRIWVRYSADQRNVVLERGEVHITVAPDKDRPFNVYVGNSFVQAVGTAFNLEITDDQRVELIVTEGKVLVGLNKIPVSPETLSGEQLKAVSPAENSMIIDAGEFVVLGDLNDEVEKLEAEELEVKLSWRGGDLIFRGEPLAEAIAEIERYTQVEFVITDEELKKVRVAGLFKAGDVEGLLLTLEQYFNVVYQRVAEDKIILSSQSD